MWLLLELYGAAVTGTSMPSFSLVIACTHRWVRGFRDAAVSALRLNDTILVSGMAIPAPTAYLSLAPLLLLLFGDSSSGTSLGSSAALPFTNELSNTSGTTRGQIDQDRMDGRAIQKAQGPVSAAGTVPHKGSVRGRGTYGAFAPHGHGAVEGISPFVNV